MKLTLPSAIPAPPAASMTSTSGVVEAGRATCMHDDAEQPLLPEDVLPYRSVSYRQACEPADPRLRHRDLGEGHAAGWCLRQSGAAEKLGKLWRKALPLRGLPRSYGDWGSGGASLTEEQAAECQAAWTAYDAAMAHVEKQCGSLHASALRMVVVYSEPSPLERAWRVREALTYLADYWRLDAWGLERR